MKLERLENLALALTAVFSLLLCATAVLSIGILIGLLSQFAVMPLHAQTSPAVELQAAMTKEQVDGDLKTAIAAYQKIAADKAAPRDVRSKALLHLAGCYEKLGQQAQSVYQQIVRDFADQPAATQARARLAALKQGDRSAAPTAMTQRKIQPLGTCPDPEATNCAGPGDTDGHRMVYANFAAGEVVYGDLAQHSEVVLFRFKPGGLGWFIPSRDFSKVLLGVPGASGGQLAVVNTDGTGYREIGKLEVQLRGVKWSWDNRYVLIWGQSPGGKGRLLSASLADGQTRELVTLETGTVASAAFSPDGRFVAYEVPSPSVTDPESRMFVVPAQGGPPLLVYQQRLRWVSPWQRPVRLLDWTADGRYLAIASDRTGKGALHLLPMKDGKSGGDPVFVKYGDFEEGVTTASGGMVYTSVKPGGLWSVYLTSLDADSRPGDWKRLDLPLGNTYNPWPQWSVDSREIVYSAMNEDSGQSGGEVVHLRSLSTGADREIYHALGYSTCAWAFQQPKLFCSDYTAERSDIFSIASDSGEIARLHTFETPAVALPYPSQDDRALYMTRILGDGAWELLRWEIATGRQTILEKFIPTKAQVLISPDERWLMRVNITKNSFDIRPVAGGDWKSLVSFSGSNAWRGSGHVNDTPDGKWLLYHDVDSTGKHSLFRIAAAGGSPERLGDFPTKERSGTLVVSPDGSKILVSAGEPFDGYELWSLENFVPPAPKP